MEFSSGDACYSIVPVVVVTRNTDGWLDFTISHSERSSIEECERIAKEFLRWVNLNIDIWRNEYFNISQNNKDNGR